MSNVTYNGIENHTQELIKGFLAGVDYSLDLSEKVLCTFDSLDNTSYPRMLEHVKGLLRRIKGDCVNNVFFLTMPYELSKKEKAVLVRFINISYKENENIILLNNDVLYIGSAYSKFDPQKVKDYVETNFAELQQLYRAKQRREKFKQWRKQFFQSLRLSKWASAN